MKCKVDGCRYSSHHWTKNHKCGKCYGIGHGQKECGDFSKIFNLKQVIEAETPHKMIMVPYNEKCDKSIYKPCIVLDFSENIRDALSENNKHWIMFGVGMGCCIYARNNNGLVEYVFLYDTDKQQINSSLLLQEFTHKYNEYTKPAKLLPPVPFHGLLD